jgi:hypothetical protein
MMSYFYRFRPDRRGTFSCLPKRKYPKRTAPGGLSGHQSAINARLPCAFRENRRSRNSRSRYARLRSDKRELYPASPAMLGCVRRSSNPSPIQLQECSVSAIIFNVFWDAPQPRQAQPSIAAISGLSEPPCLSWICKPQARQILRVRRAPEMTRSAGNPRQRTSLRDRLSFGYFSLAEQRKVARRKGETRAINYHTYPEKP